MFLGGLWHGASWNFVLWGILHGAYLASHKLLINKFPVLKNISFFKTKLGKIVAILITQYFVLLAWIPFRVQDTEHMFYSIQKFILFDFDFLSTIEFISANHKITSLFIIIFIVLHIISFKNPDLIERISRFRLITWMLFLMVIMLSILLFYVGYDQNFIYFQF